MLKFKPGVKIAGVRPEIALAIHVADDIYGMNDIATCVVTSVTEGKHGFGSLHFSGAAFDLRVSNFKTWKQRHVVDELRKHLTDEFDVVLEKDHIHVEFQPKN